MFVPVVFQSNASVAQSMPVENNRSPTLTTNAKYMATCISTNTEKHPYAQNGFSIRRLTPLECERLQGFPDNWTLIPTRKARKVQRDMEIYLMRKRPDLSPEQIKLLAADSPRYKAIGNSMAVPVMRWIGERIKMVDSLKL